MWKKIGIAAIIIAIITVVIIFAVPWGAYESKLEKSELSETVEYDTTNSDESNQPPSMEELEGEYYVNSENSEAAEILFHVAGLKNTKGGFEDFNITLDVPEDYTNAKIDVVIQTASINTGNTMRDKHLKEAEFFNVEKYPTTEYHSTSVVMGDTSYIAKGELTLNGMTTKLELPFKHLGRGGEEESAFEAFEGYVEFDRTKRGQEAYSGVGDIIELSFYCELKPQ